MELRTQYSVWSAFHSEFKWCRFRSDDFFLCHDSESQVRKILFCSTCAHQLLNTVNHTCSNCFHYGNYITLLLFYLWKIRFIAHKYTAQLKDRCMITSVPDYNATCTHTDYTTTHTTYTLNLSIITTVLMINIIIYIEWQRKYYYVLHETAQLVLPQGNFN